jgi:hypothetical protein
MATIEITGRINEDGQIELNSPANLPPGEVRIIIETIDPEAEEADDARWDALFASSQDVLARMADEALRDLDEGQTEELDPDNL